METLFIYFIKASGLIALFYLAYVLLLRRETFFTANRWFLLLGLLTSTILPLFFITKIIWVEPTTDSFDWSNIPVTTTVANPEPEINWYLIAACVYTIAAILLLVKLLFDFYSLSKLFKGKTIQQQENFKLIDVTENIAPFSFFKSIVYNSSLYTPTEMENILEHEKVHSSQNHSVDVLLSRLFCIAFWFNPLIWFYKKAIIQNLEFIADSEAAKNTSDKKAYQLTLLKITTQENCVAISNHFYQSLIKKRIIMLNKNQSKKWNSWKYISVFPALVAFVFLFQIEVVAQEKEVSKQENETKSEPIDLKPFKVDKDSITSSESREIYINGETSSEEELAKLDPKEIERIDVTKISGKKTILVTTKHLLKPVKITDKDIYIDGVKSTDEEFSKLDKKNIDKIDVNTFENTVRLTTKNEKPLIIVDGVKQASNFKIEDIPTDQITKIDVLKGIHATGKHGESAKNGAIEITTKEKIYSNNFKPIQRKTAIGFQTLKQDQKINQWKLASGHMATSSKEVNGLKVESGPMTNTSKESIVKNDWIVGYGNNGENNSINRIIENKTINYKKAVIVIDGKQSNYKTLKKLNPKEVESVIVADIKNASEEDRNKAIQLYGKKALNGFIQINTKTKNN